ncbi:hypothetical protein J3A83DRAFT_4188253 [Scleroderma citrinum]
MHQSATAFFTAEDKQRHPYLSSVLEPSAYKVIATAAVRVYYAPFINPHLNWSYSKLRGILVFGRDREGLVSPATAPALPLSPPPPDRSGGFRLKEKYWFRLIDVKTNRVVWMFPVPEVFEYYRDKPFFHYFSGTTRMFGFCFDEDVEADVFFKKVVDRTRRHFFGPFRSRANSIKKQAKPTNPLKLSNSKPAPPVHQPLTRPSTATPLKPSMISGPTLHSFVHVSHVGVSTTGEIESSKNIEPAWSALLADLQGRGFESEGEVVSDTGHYGNDVSADFMQGFLAGAKATKEKMADTSEHEPSTNQILFLAYSSTIRRKPTLTFASTSAPTSPPVPARALSPMPVPSSLPAPTPAPIPAVVPTPVPPPEPSTVVRSPSPAPGSPPPEKKRKIRRRVLLL